MAFKIDSDDFANFLEKDQNGKNGSENLKEDEKDIKFVTPKGDILYHENTISEHLSILQGKYQLHDDVAISGHGDSSILEMHFNISNQGIAYKTPTASKDFVAPMSGNMQQEKTSIEGYKISLTGTDNAKKKYDGKCMHDRGFKS